MWIVLVISYKTNLLGHGSPCISPCQIWDILPFYFIYALIRVSGLGGMKHVILTHKLFYGALPATGNIVSGVISSWMGYQPQPQ